MEIYEKAIKHKYKFFKLWKILTFVFASATILFATLYFVS